MGQSSKNQDFISYILDNFVRFRRQFIIETKLPMEVCLRALENITNDYGYGTSRPIYSTIQRGIKHDRHTFTVIAQDGPNQNGRKNAVIEGVVTVASDGTAVIRGEARMKIFPNWIIIAVAAAILIYAVSIISNAFFNVYSIFAWIYGVFYTAPIVLFLWTRMYGDRNKIIQIVEESVQSGNVSRLIDSSEGYEVEPFYYRDEKEKQDHY